MLQYALYCRKSKKEDGDTIKSIEDQRKYWEERGPQLGILIAKVYEENESAKIPDKRPIWRELITDLENGRVDAVATWHINRLSRNPKESGEFAQLLVDGIVQEVRTPNGRYTPADNILPLMLEQGTAVQSSRDLSSTMKLSGEQKAKAGGLPRQAPIGYLNARDPDDIQRGITNPDPERYALVRRGMDKMLTGQHSMREVIDAMNSWGLRTRPTKNRPSKKLSYSSGYVIFANPFYAGFVRHRGLLYPGNHKKMLTAHEFANLQEIRKRFMREKGTKRSFTYAGMMRCGLCGYQVVGELRNKGGKQYIYYHCSDSRKRCNKRAIPEHTLERQIQSALQRLTIQPEAAQAAQEAIRRWFAQGTALLVQTRQQQRARLAAVDRERAALLDLLVDGTVRDKELYSRKDAALREERNKVMLSSQQSKADASHILEQVDATFAFAITAATEYATADNQRKRAIAGALGFQYTLRNREVTITADPTLEKVVAFAHQKTRSLEPGHGGFESTKEPSFSQTIQFGSGHVDPLEPPDELINALRESHFPNLYE
jgi:site-specific DNA recombinase